jgi:hypothetical protein
MKEHKQPSTENNLPALEEQAEEQAGFGSNSDRLAQIGSGPKYDVDGSGSVQDTDGLMIMRYQFGFRGDALTAGLSTSASGADIGAYIGELEQAGDLDVTGEGKSDPFTDGLLIQRHIMGVEGNYLVQGALPEDAKRTSLSEIDDFLSARSGKPKKSTAANKTPTPEVPSIDTSSVGTKANASTTLPSAAVPTMDASHSGSAQEIAASTPSLNTGTPSQSGQASTIAPSSSNTAPEIASLYTRTTQVMFDEESVDVYFNGRDAEWDPLDWQYNWSGDITGKGEEKGTTWIKLSFNIPELGLIAGDSFNVEGTVRDPSGLSDTESINIDVIGEEIKTWEVLFDNADQQTSQRVDLRGDREREEERERERDRERERERASRRSDPLVFDLDKDGILDTATGSHLADGNIDGETVLFDIDPSRASWAFVSSTDVPGLDAPALPNGRAVYEDGTREVIGGNGQWNAQQSGGNFTHAKAKLFNSSGEWVGEWTRQDPDSYDYFWGSRADAERTEWLKKGTNDGFLVWDHNGNGMIDDNTEMMSEFDREGNEVFANGYEKLRHYFDKDNDGIIQGQELHGLMFWVDSNADAQTDSGEIKTLDQYGITHIQIPEEGELTSSSTIGKVPTK